MSSFDEFQKGEFYERRSEMANEQIEVVATFDDDTKRQHRFTIDEGQGITGSIYVPKGSAVPDIVTIRLRTQAEAKAEAEKKGQE